MTPKHAMSIIFSAVSASPKVKSQHSSECNKDNSDGDDQAKESAPKFAQTSWPRWNRLVFSFILVSFHSPEKLCGRHFVPWIEARRMASPEELIQTELPPNQHSTLLHFSYIVGDRTSKTLIWGHLHWGPVPKLCVQG